MVDVLDPSRIAMTPNPEPNPTYSHHDPTEIIHSAPSSLPHATSTSITAALEYAALL